MLVEEIDRIFDLLTIQCNRELTKQAVLYLGRTYNCFPLRMYDRLCPYPHDWRLPFRHVSPMAVWKFNIVNVAVLVSDFNFNYSKQFSNKVLIMNFSSRKAKFFGILKRLFVDLSSAVFEIVKRRASR